MHLSLPSRPLWQVALVAGLFLIAACTSAQETAPPDPSQERALQEIASPEVSYLQKLGKRAEGERGMVTAAHPLAVEAGAEMLRRGGNAVDAAVATAFVVSVVEPMMSGIGGGGSMVIWRSEEEAADFLEFYASAGEDPDHGLEELPDSLQTPERMVAVPGTVAGLLSAHERYGELSREAVVQPAVEVAREGFLVHPLLARVIEDEREKLTADSGAAEVFYPNGRPLQAGERLVQPTLAATLDRIAEKGREGFYRGTVAEAAIERLAEGDNPLTLEDFAQYEPRWQRPLCGTYGGHTVLSATPPLDGVEVLQALNLLAPYDLPSLGLPAESPEALGRLVDAIRIARADRGAWVGDPDETGVPAVGLASPEFAEERRTLIGGTVPEGLEAGDPWDEETATEPSEACATLNPYPPTSLPRPEPEPTEEGSNEEEEESHTTHLSVVDEAGNAVSLTYTMGRYFGSGVFIDGAFYNSAALNFGGPEANRRASFRTPRSTTAPTLVLDGNDVRLVVGSPGSGRIPPAIVQMILYTLDYGLDPAEAIRMPRPYPYVNSPVVRVEQDFSAEALSGLRERGYELQVEPPTDMYFGGVHMVYVGEDGTMIGVADPRRNGAARGVGEREGAWTNGREEE